MKVSKSPPMNFLDSAKFGMIVSKAWFPLDRNAIVESHDSSMFGLTAERLMGIYGNTFFFHKLEPTWVRLMPKILTYTYAVSQNQF